MEAAEALVCDVGAVAAISAVYRVGVVAGNRPRTLVVKFETEQNRNEVYNNLRNLRGKDRWNKISVVPDLTKMQCLEEKVTYKQVTRGHNIVADGWAGASNPHPHPMPPPPTHIPKLVIQGSHMVSGTRCPAWSDPVKKWS